MLIWNKDVFSVTLSYKLPIVEKQIIDCMLTVLMGKYEVRTDFFIGYLMKIYCEFLYERNYGNSSENTHLHYNDLRGFDGITIAPRLLQIVRFV